MFYGGRCMKSIKINRNIIMLTMLLVFIILVALFGKMMIAHADQAVTYDKSFISIEIENGDTLTTIAQAYAVSEAEYEDYIQEVMQINNLKNDTIHAGCYLMVPVYTPSNMN